MKNEIWKDIQGYEGLYQVSNLGRVKSLERYKSNHSCKQLVPERIIKVRKNWDGYLKVTLCKDGKVKTYKVHRLVATAFIENPDNLKEINHKDEDKINNCVENLEWCTRVYNCNYGTRSKRSAEKHSKPVIGIHKITGLILEFPSTMEAERQIGIRHDNISNCCKGKQKSAGGYYWHYVENDSYNHYISQND